MTQNARVAVQRKNLSVEVPFAMVADKAIYEVDSYQTIEGGCLIILVPKDKGRFKFHYCDDYARLVIQPDAWQTKLKGLDLFGKSPARAELRDGDLILLTVLDEHKMTLRPWTNRKAAEPVVSGLKQAVGVVNRALREDKELSVEVAEDGTIILRRIEVFS